MWYLDLLILIAYGYTLLSSVLSLEVKEKKNTIDCYKCSYGKSPLAKRVLGGVILVAEKRAKGDKTGPTKNDPLDVDEDQNCRDPFSYSYLYQQAYENTNNGATATDSSHIIYRNCTSCIKLKFMMADQEEGIARLCSDLPPENECTELVEKQNEVVSCSCSKPMCNTAATHITVDRHPVALLCALLVSFSVARWPLGAT